MPYSQHSALDYLRNAREFWTFDLHITMSWHASSSQVREIAREKHLKSWSGPWQWALEVLQKKNENKMEKHSINKNFMTQSALSTSRCRVIHFHPTLNVILCDIQSVKENCFDNWHFRISHSLLRCWTVKSGNSLNSIREQLPKFEANFNYQRIQTDTSKLSHKIYSILLSLSLSLSLPLRLTESRSLSHSDTQPFAKWK